MITEQNDIIIVRYLMKKTSPEENKELLSWLDEKEENRQYFRTLKDAFDLGQFEKTILESDATVEWKKLLKRLKVGKPVVMRVSFRKIGRYAAIFALGLLCMKGGEMMSRKGKEAYVPLVTQVETGKGERSKLTLPDSSVVWLNACSAISYDQSFGQTIRRVDMKGEAFFEVHHDTGKPFVVHTQGLAYRVTGTSFNLYSFDNDNIVQLVLEEGAVAFEYEGQTIEVTSGELVEFNTLTRQTYRKNTNPGFYTSWRYGELMFDKMTFGELAMRLERNFNVIFVFQNEKLKKEIFGGTFRDYDSLETILKVISTSTPIRYKIEKNVVYIN